MSIADIAAQVMSQKGYRDKAIDGAVYSVKMLPAFTGIAVGKKLSELALPVITMIVDQEGNADTWDADSTPLTSIALVLSSQLDKVDVVETVQQLLGGCLKDGQAVDINTEFAAKYDALFELIAFALQENFGSFFTKFLKAKGLEIPSVDKLIALGGQTSKE